MPKKLGQKPINKIKQIGGTDDLNDVHLWGQDQSPPGSYKIQLGYLEIPKTITFKEKWMDTPYRFGSFHDANQEAGRIFDGYVFRISASNDRPHWDAPSYLHQPRRLSNTDPQWYDTFAVKPIRDNRYAPDQLIKDPPHFDDRTQYSIDQLSKLKTKPNPALKPVSLNANSQSKETVAPQSVPTMKNQAGRGSSRPNQNLKS
jgi:hypothetical protein